MAYSPISCERDKRITSKLVFKYTAKRLEKYSKHIIYLRLFIILHIFHIYPYTKVVRNLIESANKTQDSVQLFIHTVLEYGIQNILQWYKLKF